MGGAASFGPSSDPVVYHVPWQVLRAGQAAPTGNVSLLVYWLPVSSPDALGSPLQTSRGLTQARGTLHRHGAGRSRAPGAAPGFRRFGRGAAGGAADSRRPRAGPGGGQKRQARGGRGREALERQLSISARPRPRRCSPAPTRRRRPTRTGRSPTCKRYGATAASCPARAKRRPRRSRSWASRWTRRRSRRSAPEGLPDSGALRESLVEAKLRAGLEAELAADYVKAEALYREAAELDPADATPSASWASSSATTPASGTRRPPPSADLLGPAGRPAFAGGGPPRPRQDDHPRRQASPRAWRSSRSRSPPSRCRSPTATWRSTGIPRSRPKRPPAIPGRRWPWRRTTATTRSSRRSTWRSPATTRPPGRWRSPAPTCSRPSYNLAAIWAQLGDRAKAMELLEAPFLRIRKRTRRCAAWRCAKRATTTCSPRCTPTRPSSS